ncbi:hypothetical protein WISP_103975 [Willisornis vidua]|uniref:Uncharacterized protein n=1 Tax=Willisornis vidua TaxID=1566151 RepID=A0ABQ9D0H4_9PASS|nr:hypothetical protein WISP_103975 [Willisornis vidua]
MNKWLFGTRHLRLCYRKPGVERERSAMAVGIFRMCLVLMAVVSVNQPLFTSEENGIVPENREEIIQRMKEREVNLQFHQWRLEQEIAAQEARQEALERSALELERKIRRYMWKMLSLVIFALMKLCRQHLQEVICQHSREEETDMEVLGKHKKE